MAARRYSSKVRRSRTGRLSSPGCSAAGTFEASVLDALGDKHGHVIATGGGFPCRPGVMERLKGLGTVVWLAADFDALYERGRRVGGRPMLAGRTREEAAALYEARKASYSQTRWPCLEVPGTPEKAQWPRRLPW